MGLSEVEKKVVSYIKEYRKKGYSDDKIKSALLKSGISEDVIKKGFKLAKSRVVFWTVFSLLIIGVLVLGYFMLIPEEKFECSVDRDCGSGYKCVNGVCFLDVEEKPECIIDGDCASGYECVSGECALIEEKPECNYDMDCEPGYECKSGVCKKKKVEPQCGDGNCDIGEESCYLDCGCETDAECATHGSYKCSSLGDCYKSIGISGSSSSSSSGGSTAGLCDSVTCNNGFVCDANTGSCICDGDEDCGTGYECSLGACVVSGSSTAGLCDSDEDCDVSEYCSGAGECLSGCNEDTDCLTGACNLENHVCGCSDSDDCLNDEVCYNYECRGCLDSDGGLMSQLPGMINGVSIEGILFMDINDSCSGNVLREYYCSNASGYQRAYYSDIICDDGCIETEQGGAICNEFFCKEDIDCPETSVCIDGECTKCIETDVGEDYDLAGTISGVFRKSDGTRDYLSFSDSCEYGKIHEYFCDIDTSLGKTFAEESIIDCNDVYSDDGLLKCSSGACVSAEDCINGVDDDGDGLIDCADSDCNGISGCVCSEVLPECADGVDNDLDGLIDLADSECTDWEASEDGELNDVYDDGGDDGGDDDPGLGNSELDNSGLDGNRVGYECNNKFDDDGDELIDYYGVCVIDVDPNYNAISCKRLVEDLSNMDQVSIDCEKECRILNGIYVANDPGCSSLIDDSESGFGFLQILFGPIDFVEEIPRNLNDNLINDRIAEVAFAEQQFIFAPEDESLWDKIKNFFINAYSS